MWFRKAKPALTFPEPTEDERIALLAEKREDDRNDILRAGGGSLWAASNVAYGTYGYHLNSLRADGLLRSEWKRGALPHEDRCVYTLTDLGRDALANLEKGG